MKTFNLALLSLALAGLGAASDADARGGRGGHHHSRVGVGVFVGAPFYPYYSPYYYPRYYYPPAVYAPSAPPVYIEQSAAGAAALPGPAQGQTAYWYFCQDSQTYYPYAQQCASQWQQVLPQASASPQ
jgi:hypothetical protein